MKKSILYTVCTVAIVSFILMGCEKNEFSLKDNVFVTGKALLKVNFGAAYRVTPTYQIKIDGVRVSSNLTFFTPFPGGGLNTGGGSTADFLGVEPGSHKVTISLPFVGTEKDSVEIASATVNLTADKYHSLYFADTAANTTNLLFEDNMTSPDSGFVKYRVINLMPDLAAGIDLYLGTGYTSTTSTKVAGPILYKQMGDYITLPANPGVQFWSIRPAGAAATTTAIATYTSASTIVNQRVFTIAIRGYNAATTTGDPRIKAISFIYNR